MSTDPTKRSDLHFLAAINSTIFAVIAIAFMELAASSVLARYYG